MTVLVLTCLDSNLAGQVFSSCSREDRVWQLSEIVLSGTNNPSLDPFIYGQTFLAFFTLTVICHVIGIKARTFLKFLK